MKKNKQLRFWLSIGLLILPLFYALFVYQELPERLGTRFNFQNQAVASLPKGIFVFAMPVFMLFLQLFIYWTMTKKKLVNPRFESLLIWGIPIFNAFIYCSILYRNLHPQVSLSKLGVFLLGLVFILIGNYLPKKVQEDRKPAPRSLAYLFLFFGLVCWLVGFIFL